MKTFRLSILFIMLTYSMLAQNKTDFFSLENFNKQNYSNMKFDNTKIEELEGQEFDVKFYRLQLDINPEVCYISGNVTCWFETTKATDFVVFNLTNQLAVDSVKFRSQNISYTHENELLTINLTETIPTGIIDSLTIFYAGTPYSGDGFGSFVQTSTPFDVPIVWTLSEPFGAKDWWPNKQTLSDKADSVYIYVKSPETYRTASNGLLKVDIVENGIRTCGWKHRHPIEPYLIAVSVSDYAVYSDIVPLENGNLEVLNYVYPQTLEESMAASEKIIPIMQLFNNLFIQYPFSDEKYGHVQIGWGGGMEHQTMSSMGNLSFALMAHELAHQWFGDYITCGSWHDIWINEGFAEYVGGMAYQYLLDGIYWEPFIEFLIERVTAENTPCGSVYVPEINDVGRIFDTRLTYYKGAMLLHMLRWKLGDEAFFTAIRNYLNDNDLINNYAFAVDAKAHFEAASGYDLSAFFNSWYYGEGYPIYNIEWQNISQNTVKVTINQSPSCEGAGFFEMPIPIRFYGSEGDSIIVFENTFSGQEYTVEIGFEVNGITFDPDKWILTSPPVIVNVDSQFVENSVRLAPVPTNGDLEIFFPYTIVVNELKIFDLNGKLMMNIQNEKPVNKLKISVEQLQSGTYLLHINTGKDRIGKLFTKI